MRTNIAGRHTGWKLGGPAVLVALVVLIPAVGEAQVCNTVGGMPVEIKTPACLNACTDGIDNDNDGTTDGADSSCGVEKIFRDPNNADVVLYDACHDGIDNDSDALTDEGTLGTFVAGIGDSSCHEARCQDNLDNDGDGKIDQNDEDCYCFIDVVNGLLNLGFPSNYCTANDVKIVLIGLGIQRDGCINQNDKLSILFEADLQTTANTRYDVGMWIALDGGDAGNYTPLRNGLCGRQILRPASGATGTCTSGIGDCSVVTDAGFGLPAFHDGPYRTETQAADRDRCGEIQSESFTTTTYDAVIDLVEPPAVDTLTTSAPLLAYDIPCTDVGVNLPGTPVTDGFVDVGTCSSWDQNSGTACNNFSEAYTKENPKCRCERTPTDVPSPNMNLSCGAGSVGDNGILTFGEAVTNTVTVTNTVANCTPNLATTERFRCGTASYVRIVVDYPEAYGSITASSDTPTNDDSRIDTGSSLVWTIKNEQAANSLGIVGTSATPYVLSYTFTRNNVPFNGTISFPTTTYWSNTLDTGNLTNLSDAIAQACTGCVCDSPIGTTPVTLTSFKAMRSGPTVHFEWSTATEVENVGFNIYGESPNGWILLNSSMIPATGGGIDTHTYSVTLDVPAEITTFAIEDVDRTGKATRHPEVKAVKGEGGTAKGRVTQTSAVHTNATAGGGAGNS